MPPMFLTAVDDGGRPLDTAAVLESSAFRQQPAWAGDDEGYCTGTFRLDDTVRLAQELQVDPGGADVDLVLAAYRRWGDACVQRLQGDFAFAVWNARERKMLAARDRLGVRPVFFVAQSALRAVGATPALLRHLPGVDTDSDPVWMAHELLSAPPPATTSAYVGIRRLPPAHLVSIDATGSAHLVRYHDFAIDAPDEQELDPRWLADYRAALLAAVATRMTPTGTPQAVELTGGLDSTSLAAAITLLDPQGAGQLHGFCIGWHESDTSGAVEAAHHLQIPDMHVINAKRWARKRTPEFDQVAVTALGFPAQRNNAKLHIPIYERCQALGLRRLHSGYGGDHAVTQHARYLAAQTIARQGWRQGVRRLGLGWSDGRALAHVLRTRTGPPPERQREGTARMPVSGLARELVGPQLNGRFELNAAVTTQELAGWMPIRLEQCTLIAATYDVEYTWPLLDAVLIQQWLATPTVWKWQQGEGRYLHRRAAATLVPAELGWQPGQRPSGGSVWRDDQRMRDQWLRVGTETAASQARELTQHCHPTLQPFLNQPALARSTVMDGTGKPDRPLMSFLYRASRLNAWLSS